MMQINCDAERELCSKLNQGSYPSVLFANGDIMNAIKYDGPLTEKGLYQFIDDMLNPKEQTEEIQEEL